MIEENPYAPPEAEVVTANMVGAPMGGANLGVYRQGKLLVMHKSAKLPDRCVKSNEPAFGRTLKRSLTWHHPAIYLSILVSILIYVILALILRKTATIYIGLSDLYFAKRIRAIMLGWGFVLAGIVLFIVGIVYIDQEEWMGLLIPGGIFVGLAAAIYGLIAARMVSPQKITDTHVYLKGVHPDYLAELPEFPGEYGFVQPR